MNDDNKQTQGTNGAGDPGAEHQPTQTPDPQGNETGAKTFTQEELDLIVQNRLRKEREKMPSKEELEAYKAWQAEQKKDEPENKEAEEAKRQLAKAQAELVAYKNREKVLKSGVSPEFSDFVTYEVGKLVTDESDFESELIKWLKTNEHYTKQDDSKPQGAGGMRHGGAPAKKDGVEEEFYKLNPHLKKEG